MNIKSLIQQIERKIDEIEDELDILEDLALKGRLDVDKLLQTRDKINILLRQINRTLYSEELDDSTHAKLMEFRSYLHTLKEDLLNLINVNETIVNKKIGNTLNKLAFVSMAFAPATFVAGLYGMNFQYGVIPPWNSPHGFLLAIVIIILVTLFSMWLVNYVTLEE